MKLLSWKTVAWFAAAFAALAAGNAQTFTYNFNSGATDFQSTFTANLPASSGATVTYSATAGVGGSGSFSTNGVSNATTIYNTALANASGTTFTSSFYFQTRSTVSEGDLVGFGYFNSTTQLFDSGNMIGYKINGSNSSSLVPSSWYKLTAVTTNTGSTFQTSISLQNYGADGLTLTGSSISIGSSNNAGGTLLGTGSIYFGIYGGLGTQGGGSANYMTPAIDNFSATVSAIPEPSTYAAIAGSAMLGLAVWRRRRASPAAAARD